MKRLKKASLVVLAAAMVLPAALPMNASAKAKPKTYKISKNILKSKSKLMFKQIHNYGFIVYQPSAKRLQIIASAAWESDLVNYKITSQKVHGNQMTYKLKPIITEDNKDNVSAGTLVLQRTGKSTYRIPKIYASNETPWYRLTAKRFKYASPTKFGKMTKVSLNGLKMTKKSTLKHTTAGAGAMTLYFKK